MASKSVQHLSQINIRDEYGTPWDVLNEAKQRYKIFPQLDVCTNLANRKCDAYYIISDNALRKPWDMDFFMNPPYSQAEQWMRYAFEQHKIHNVNGLILVYSKTDTDWWHKYVEEKAEVHFIHHRLRFLNENGNIPRYCKNCKITTEFNPCQYCENRTTINSAPYPSCWIIYRKNESRTN